MPKANGVCSQTGNEYPTLGVANTKACTKWLGLSVKPRTKNSVRKTGDDDLSRTNNLFVGPRQMHVPYSRGQEPRARVSRVVFSDIR